VHAQHESAVWPGAGPAAFRVLPRRAGRLTTLPCAGARKGGIDRDPASGLARGRNSVYPPDRP